MLRPGVAEPGTRPGSFVVADPTSRKRARAQGVTLGRPKGAQKMENAIRVRLVRGEGILRIAKAWAWFQHRPADQGGGRAGSMMACTRLAGLLALMIAC